MQTLTVHWPPAGAVAVDVAVLGVRAGGVGLATLLAAAVLVRLEEGDGADGECVAEASVRRGEHLAGVFGATLEHLAGVFGAALPSAAIAVRGAGHADVAEVLAAVGGVDHRDRPAAVRAALHAVRGAVEAGRADGADALAAAVARELADLGVDVRFADRATAADFRPGSRWPRTRRAAGNHSA